MKTIIRKSVIKTKLGFQGRISIYENDLHLWTQNSEIDRLNQIDAQDDARKLEAELN